MSQAAVGHGGVTEVHAARLFNASCIALTAGAAMFAITSDIMGPLKQQFILSNEEVGMVMGWSGWGFTIGMLVLGPLCDALGMRLLLRLALVFHAAGVALMIFAGGFWMLLAGGIVNALGSGAVEAACNPLTATIYPDKKTHKLNQFHMWFPGGIVLGGLACYGLDALGHAGLTSALAHAGLNLWQLKLAIVLVPTAAYGVLFTGQYFPPTERVQSGVSFGGMFKETLLRPLFLVLLACMMLTASLELGPNRWVAPVLEAGGIPGILVLVWITGLMAVLRLVAGPVVRWFTNTGLLLASAVVSGIGLLALSLSGSLPASGTAATVVVVGAAATVFAFGVCYFWPTMLGVVAERVPKGGALALAVIGGLGGLFVNTVTTPLMGTIADKYLHRELVFRGTVDGRAVDRERETVAVLEEVGSAYANWSRSLGDARQDEVTRRDIQAGLAAVTDVLDAWRSSGSLPETATANALRAAIRNGPPDSVEEGGSEAARAALAAKKKAAAILGPADNKGGLMAFRYVAPLSIILIIAFGVMFIQDRMRGRAARSAGRETT